MTGARLSRSARPAVCSHRKAGCEILEELRAVGQDTGTDIVEHIQGQSSGISRGLQHQRRHRADEHRPGHPLGYRVGRCSGPLRRRRWSAPRGSRPSGPAFPRVWPGRRLRCPCHRRSRAGSSAHGPGGHERCSGTPGRPETASGLPGSLRSAASRGWRRRGGSLPQIYMACLRAVLGRDRHHGKLFLLLVGGMEKSDHLDISTVFRAGGLTEGSGDIGG